ncbi:zinc-ribbon domain-containing protein [Bacillus mycoides]|uniref:zinc-ribbon domain-containing protein n=1 Tax=Bacillus mycoides TaxID=1405 RepID=UPI00399C7666
MKEIVKVQWTPAFQSYNSAGDESEPFCVECETYLQDDFKYCPGCGSRLDWGDVK